MKKIYTPKKQNIIKLTKLLIKLKRNELLGTRRS